MQAECRSPLSRMDGIRAGGWRRNAPSCQRQESTETPDWRGKRVPVECPSQSTTPGIGHPDSVNLQIRTRTLHHPRRGPNRLQGPARVMDLDQALDSDRAMEKNPNHHPKKNRLRLMKRILPRSMNPKASHALSQAANPANHPMNPPDPPAEVPRWARGNTLQSKNHPSSQTAPTHPR